MTQVEKRSDAKVTERKYPPSFKMRPMGQDAMLKLPVPEAKQKLRVTMEAGYDSRSLTLTFSNNEVASEDFTGRGLELRDGKGKVVQQRISNFGVYGTEKVFDLETSNKAHLMIKRSAEGDLTMWIKGTDLSGAEDVPHPSKDYVITHVKEGKVVGYTIKDFLDHVNMSFTFAMVELPL